MIIGTGVDIVEIDKMKEVVERWGNKFLRRVFTPGEIRYSRKRRLPYQHLAARFAAKEAVFKAFGGALWWTDVEVVNEPLGKPRIRLNGNAKTLKERFGVQGIEVAISHTANYAVASAILIGDSTKRRIPDE